MSEERTPYDLPERYITGPLALVPKQDPRPLLALCGHPLTPGTRIEILIGGQWIAGQMTAWYIGKELHWCLDTGCNPDPVIVLRPGVQARMERI